MGHAAAVLVLLCLFAHISSSWPGDKVKLTKVQVLTLRRWHYTTARRSHPVPQLNCRGGSAGCRDQPSVVQCYNRGTDGVDVQWECKAAMKRSQKFGFIQVTCEGYDYPRDIYILMGSCGLEYYLEIAGRDGGSSYGTRGQHRWREDHDSTITFPSFWDFVLIVLVAIVVYALACWCFSLYAALGSNGNDHQEHPESYAGQQEQTNRPAAERRSQPPPYNPYDTPPPYNPNYCSRSQRPSANHGEDSAGQLILNLKTLTGTAGS
ncbi:hypothetical protein HPB50_010292 [Hyalomma asiaticum]|uniref:Uncharacterized protein n=1 Tax=Hyalomma asiaticum TaxID=266040 RepID=A0ACB7S1T4_HYAAI|nr:hypothetical protein HPB50_010292 [Hyalomma asiaticum]